MVPADTEKQGRHPTRMLIVDDITFKDPDSTTTTCVQISVVLTFLGSCPNVLDEWPTLESTMFKGARRVSLTSDQPCLGSALTITMHTLCPVTKMFLISSVFQIPKV